MRDSSSADSGITDSSGADTVEPPPDCVLPEVPSLGVPSAARFGAAQPLTELNSTAGEDDPTLTADRLDIFFESNRSGMQQLWHARRALAADPFDPPTLVTELADQRANTPKVSRDGLTLYFASPGPSGDDDIFVTHRERRDSGWGEPALVEDLSSMSSDTGAAPFLEGRATVFFSNRPGGPGGGDLWSAVAEGIDCAGWSAPLPLPGMLNTPSSQSNAWVRADGLVVAYQAVGTVGAGDLHYAYRETLESPFGVPVELTELNSGASDDDPWLTDDMSEIYFVSLRTGNSDIYRAVR